MRRRVSDERAVTDTPPFGDDRRRCSTTVTSPERRETSDITGEYSGTCRADASRGEEYAAAITISSRRPDRYDGRLSFPHRVGIHAMQFRNTPLVDRVIYATGGRLATQRLRLRFSGGGVLGSYQGSGGSWTCSAVKVRSGGRVENRRSSAFLDIVRNIDTKRGGRPYQMRLDKTK